MNVATWNLNNNRTVTVTHTFWGHIVAKVDDRTVYEGRKWGLSKRVDFRLDDANDAQVVISIDAPEPEFELWVGHDVFLPEGHETRREPLPSSSGVIWLMAIVFAISAVFTFFSARESLAPMRAELVGLADEAPFPKAIRGRILTVAEVRRIVNYQMYGILTINLLLAVFMLGFAYLSKNRPVIAIALAGGLWLSVQALNAVMDPSSIEQGLLVKAIISVLVLRGVFLAFERQKGLKSRHEIA